MKMVDFEGSNSIKRAPDDEPNCSDLHTYEDVVEGKHFILSCWEITPEEILNLLIFKRIWFHVWLPFQPMIYLSATNPFTASTERVDIADKERHEAFTKRLVRQFLASKEYADNTEIPYPYQLENLETDLLDFMQFLLNRGEK